jgi:hypothetical protein
MIKSGTEVGPRQGEAPPDVVRQSGRMLPEIGRARSTKDRAAILARQERNCRDGCESR